MPHWLKRIFGQVVHLEPSVPMRSVAFAAKLKIRAEKLARAAGFRDAEETFRLLDEGKLDGTLLEAELRSIRFLQDSPEHRVLTTA